MTVTILGAGLAGLSCSYFLGHQNCIIYEKNSYLGGHIATHYRDGCYWDEGPHVSFTKHTEVRELLTWSAGGEVLEYPTNVGNSFHGHWIPHPAQSNLSSVPEPLARACFEDFLASRADTTERENQPPQNYGEWLNRAFGHTFANTFPKAYTQKYWTCHPDALTVDWVGERVYCPDVETVRKGYHGLIDRNTHYITSVRYPERGGYSSYIGGISNGANVQLSSEIVSINLIERAIEFKNGLTHSFSHLINTLPLSKFIQYVDHAPDFIKNSARELCCSEMLLVNINAKGPTLQPYHWLYVYDEDMFSTRINQTHLLSPNNTPDDSIGIQVEVYASRYRPFKESHDKIAKKVADEVLGLGLTTEIQAVHTQYVPFANIIFDHPRRKHQENILDWLSNFGLVREQDDLEPMTDWKTAKPVDLGKINLAGRFGQWKYFWTDDCILRAKQFNAI
jgi:protoporphyrinogen oxidase